MTCGSLQGFGGSACWAIEVDRGQAGDCKAYAQVTQSTSPPAGAGFNSITAPGIEVSECDAGQGRQQRGNLELDPGAQAWSRGLTRVPARVFAGSRPAPWGSTGRDIGTDRLTPLRLWRLGVARLSP